MIWLPLAALLAGSAVNSYNANKAAQRQRAASEQMFARQNEQKDRQNQVLNQTLQQFNGQDRQDNLAGIISERQQGLDNALRLSEAESQDRISESHLGDTSNAYGDYSQGANLESKTKANRLAQLMARQAGVGQLFQEENQALNLANAKNAEIAAHARALKTQDQLKIEQAGKTNPLLSLLGQGLTMYGGSGLMGNFGTVGSAAPKALPPVIDKSFPQGLY